MTGPAASVAAGVVAVAVIAVIDPNQPGRYPTCPFFAVTGRSCPGCGTLRALHAVTEGDLAAAAGLNLLAVASIPVLALTWLLWVRRRWAGVPRARPAPPALIWALAAVCSCSGWSATCPSVRRSRRSPVRGPRSPQLRSSAT